MFATLIEARKLMFVGWTITGVRTLIILGGESELRKNILRYLFPDYRCNVTSSLKFHSQWIPCNYKLYPGTINKISSSKEQENKQLICNVITTLLNIFLLTENNVLTLSWVPGYFKASFQNRNKSTIIRACKGAQ